MKKEPREDLVHKLVMDQLLSSSPLVARAYKEEMERQDAVVRDKPYSWEGLRIRWSRFWWKTVF